MMSKKEIDAMNVAFDFSKQYTVARVPEIYDKAEEFALRLVYSLRPYVADKLGIDCAEVILVAISKNNKVVVFCDDRSYRNWLWHYFSSPSVGSAQFYDDVKPELILERLDELFE